MSNFVKQLDQVIQEQPGYSQHILAEQNPADVYAVVNALTDNRSACELLSHAIPEVATGGWRLRSFKIRRIKHHHRKRIVLGTMSYQHGKGAAAQNEEVIVKVYGSDRGGKAYETLKQLWKAGFCSPGKNRVPRPYGYLSREGALLQGTALGDSWADLVRRNVSTLVNGSSRAADWLIHLQHSPLIGERKGWEGAIESIRRWSKELAVSFPWYAHRLDAVAQRMIPALQIDGIPLVPSHGDYHPMNIFLTSTFTTVIDFDTFALRDAAFDVGYSIGQLLIMSYFQTGAFDLGAEAALDFWHRYQSSGKAPWNRVAVQIARTFLQSLHYELCTLHNNRLELLKPWTNQMEAWLESSTTGIRDGLRNLHIQAGQEESR